ncbi:uncharacterized protein LOC126817873 [Patella vulgata]|nr:uncharacterized protein LOC126817873 [Patella vulgata]
MALEKIVLNSRFLKTLPYFVNFSPPAYNAHCLLAAIDFNSHKNREGC